MTFDYKAFRAEFVRLKAQPVWWRKRTLWEDQGWSHSEVEQEAIENILA